MAHCSPVDLLALHAVRLRGFVDSEGAARVTEREVGARVLAPFARGDGFNVSAGPSPGPAAFGVGAGVGAGAYGFGMGGPGVGVGVGVAPAPGTGSTPSACTTAPSASSKRFGSFRRR